MTEFVKGTLQEKQFEHLSHYPGAGSFEIANSEGKIFRNFPLVFTLGATGNSEWVRFTCGARTRLISRIVLVNTGGVTYEVYVGGTEGGTWTPVTTSCTNTENPSVVTGAIARGGTHTGGTLIDDTEVSTGTGSGALTIPDVQIGGRILPAGAVFYLKMTATGNGTKARLFLLWEEDGYF